MFPKLRSSQSKSQPFACDTSQEDSKIYMEIQKAKKRQNPIDKGHGEVTCSTRY